MINPAQKGANMTIEMPTAEELEAAAVEVQTDYLTPYRVAKVLNEWLAEYGLDPIAPQMAYNYAKKGYLPTECINGQNLVHVDVAREWCVKQLAARKAKA